MKHVTVILFVFALSGCASKINEVMDSWVGSHKSELIGRWGPPNQTTSDGLNGEILIYSSNVVLPQTLGRATTDTFGNTTYTAPQQNGYQRTRMFYVNKEGSIYSWRWQRY